MDFKTLGVTGKNRQKDGAWAVAPSILFDNTFTIDFLRFEFHSRCALWVPRRDYISTHVWYGSEELPQKTFFVLNNAIS